MEEAEFVLARLSQSARTLREIGNLKKGKLKIACNPAVSNFFMPAVVATFLKDKPNIEVALMMRSTPIVTEWIASQQYDIGFAESSQPRRTIRSQDFSFPCFCAVPKDDPLGSKPAITPADLDGKPLALLYEEHALTKQTRTIFQETGAQVKQRFELRTFQPALQLVSEGLCYMICDRLSAASHEQAFGDKSRVVFRPFEPTIFHHMSLMTPANRPLSMLVQEFVRLLSSEISKLSTEIAEK
jgi:DNA-binding transcriptional LysR family regulator